MIECATVNEVTTATSARKRRNGMTRQSRNSRWSVPSRMCRKPELDEPQRGLVPARIEPRRGRDRRGTRTRARRRPGGRKRSTVTACECPAAPGRMDRECERSDWIGYSKSTSSSAWFQKSSVLSGSRGPRDVRRRLFVGSRTTCRTAATHATSTTRGVPRLHVVFVQIDVVGEPQRRRVAQRRVGARRGPDMPAPRLRDSPRRASRASGTRTSSCSRWPPASRTPAPCTSFGMSWAAALGGSGQVNAAASAIAQAPHDNHAVSSRHDAELGSLRCEWSSLQVTDNLDNLRAADWRPIMRMDLFYTVAVAVHSSASQREETMQSIAGET